MIDAAPLELGWYADPAARHERRFYDGRRWTEHVANGDVLTTDAVPLVASAAAMVDEQPPAPTAPTVTASRPTAPVTVPARSVAVARTARFDVFEWCFKLAMVGLLVLFLVVAASALGK